MEQWTRHTNVNANTTESSWRAEGENVAEVAG